MLAHLLLSLIDAQVKIISRAVIGAVQVLHDLPRRIANLGRAQLKKGALLEKRAERLCGSVGQQTHYLLPAKIGAMTDGELLHGRLPRQSQSIALDTLT
jgi:hypothetical protein